MAYTVYKNDGSVLTIISIGEVDDLSTSLTLIGKNVNNYGEILNNNFIKLLTNFSNDIPPVSAQIGQLWFDTSNNRNRLKVYDGASWKPVFAATTTTSPDPSLYAAGDLWFDPTNKQLNVLWSFGAGELGKQWIKVGPAVNPDTGKFGIEPPPNEYIISNTSSTQNVGIVYSYTRPFQLLSASPFVISSASSLAYFGSYTATNVYSGTTILNNLTVKKNLYIEGDLNLNGELLSYPDKSLSSYYDISRFGNPEENYYTTITNTATRVSYLNTSNNAIVADLKKLFPLDSSSTYSTKGYALNSEARVLCMFNNTVTSVRRYILREIVPGVKSWDPLNSYYNIVLYTATNIVQNVDLPPPSFANTAIWSTATIGLSSPGRRTSSTLGWTVTNAVAVTISFRTPLYANTQTTGVMSTGTESWIVNYRAASVLGSYTATVVAYNVAGVSTVTTATLIMV